MGTDSRKISEMRSLGPACEADLNAVGIHTAGDLTRIGVEAAFIQMLEGLLKTKGTARSTGQLALLRHKSEIGPIFQQACRARLVSSV